MDKRFNYLYWKGKLYTLEKKYDQLLKDYKRLKDDYEKLKKECEEQ